MANSKARQPVAADALEARATSVKPQKSLSATLRDLVKEDDSVRRIVTGRLTQRAKEAKPFVEQFEAKFKDFRASKVTDPAADNRNHLRKREELRAILTQVAEKGAAVLRDGIRRRVL